eukprot:CAMPEP_0181188062 /NCGR_PEP_ID=MMETSP1096-20121128/10908_1 /TAXON_ID=156174 ORGANISM="Chrysochromulina ericina, Strain CCMP281" /NCGR_SAMPLE_ID=MMETSP1096 /ASSEMBLY_ACC=CAM_ASM_000453 /LENGTH=70 /DNA_ID=CAMNT_0023277083 /DNA_START=73 /DNA_END=286 /DNA_ORIENTATION=-
MGLGRQIGEGAVAARGEVASGADTEAAVSSRQMGQVASEVVKKLEEENNKLKEENTSLKEELAKIKTQLK